MRATSNMIDAGTLHGRVRKFTQNIKQSSLVIPFTFVSVLLVYVFSMPGDLTWSYFGGDGGELITASLTLGIPHPPGYPTYVLLGKAFASLPFGTLAERFHLLSAISMSVAAAVIAKITVEYGLDNKNDPGSPTRRDYLSAIAAGLIFAFSPLVWSQAVIAEVYALNLALLAVLIWVLISGRSPLLAGVLFGLSLTSHLTSLFMLPLCLFLLARRGCIRFIFGSLLGLLPLVVLFYLANSSSPIIWGQPDNLMAWLWLVSGRLYQSNVFSLAPAIWVDRIFSWMLLLLGQLLILALSFRRIDYSRNSRGHRRMVYVLLLTALSYGIYAFGYATPDAIVLLLPGLLLVSLVIGFGIADLGRSSLLLALVILISGCYYMVREFKPPIRYDFERAFAQIPEEAIVITPGDQTVAATWYFAYADRQRSDIIVVDNNLFQFDWYRGQLAKRYPNLHELEMDDLQIFIKTNSLHHAVCRLSMVREQYVSCILARA